MKKPYSTESWGRFKTLMQKVSKRLSVTETRAQLNEDNVTELTQDVTELQETVGKIDDITTVPNLLRGTRDFTLGSNKYSWYPGTMYEDGFANTSLDYATFNIKDQDGFTILKISQTGAASPNYKSIKSSPIYHLNTGDKITVSFDFMIEDVSEISSASSVVCLIEYFGSSVTSRVAVSEIRYIEVASTPESGKWYHVVSNITVPDGVNDLIGSVMPLLVQNGAIYFKKICACMGHVDNLDWMPSVFDYASVGVENCAPIYLGDISKFHKIPNNSDLDFITKPDTYCVLGNADAKTLTNCPTTDAFKMYVEYTNGDGTRKDYAYLRQRIVTYNEAANEYIRWKNTNSDTWGSWKQTYANTTVRPIEGGGTNASNIYGARKNLYIDRPLSVNPLNTLSDDTFDNWSSKSGGYYSFNSFTLNNQPTRYGDLSNIRSSDDAFSEIQLFYKKGLLNNSEPIIGFRIINSTGTGKNMPGFLDIFSKDYEPYNKGLYGGNDIKARFSAEIGSNHIANWLSSRVSQGNFEGLHIGDFIDIVCDGVTMRYRIGAIDPYYGSIDVQMGHHIAMIPDTPWTLSAAKDDDYAINTSYIHWNSTNDNNGINTEQHPYLASNLHKWEIEKMLPRFPKEWQDVMLMHRVNLEIRYSASAKLTNSNGCSWTNIGKIWSPSEVEVYGFTSWGTPGFSVCSDCQFPIFQLSKGRTSRRGSIGRGAYWLRTTGSGTSTQACAVSGYDSADAINTTHTFTFPLPCFMIG